MKLYKHQEQADNAHINYQQEDSTFAEQNEVITWRGIKQISNGKKDTYLTLNSQHLFHPHTHTNGSLIINPSSFFFSLA